MRTRRPQHWLLAALGLLLSVVTALGQIEEPPALRVRDNVLAHELRRLAEEFGVRIYYSPADLRGARSRPLDLDEVGLATAMTMLSVESDLTAVRISADEYAVVPDDKHSDTYVAQVTEAGRDMARRADALAGNAGGVTTPPDTTAPETAATAPDLLISGEPLYRAFDRIADRFDVDVFYHPDHVPTFDAYVPLGDLTLIELFRAATAGTNLALVKYEADTYVVAPATRQDKAYADEVVEGWRTGRFRSPDNPVRRALELTYGTGEAPAPGDTASVALRGSVFDAETDEPLFGVVVFDPARAAGTTTDLDGNFSLNVPRGPRRLELRLLGYEVQPLEIDVRGSGSALSLGLYPQTVGFDEVVVTARSSGRAQREAAAGVARITARELELLPALTGDVDVLAALTSRAGVATAAEGSAGVSVRGGALDQNLVRQAGMTVLYPAHALGFYPVFHPNLVQGVDLYRGYVPASFGGRAASVVDVEWRRGDMRRWSLAGAGGLFASRLAVEGPIVRDKLSVIAGGRVSYLNYLLSEINDRDIRRSDVGFADVGGRLTYRWRGGQLDAQGSYATDDFRYGFQFGFAYVNQSARLAVRQRVAAATTLELEASRSDYAAEREELREAIGLATFSTGLTTDRVGANLRRSFSEAVEGAAALSVEAGVEAIRYDVAPREQRPVDGSSVRPFSYLDPSLLTLAAYAQAEFASADERFGLEGGLRLERNRATSPPGSAFVYAGPPGLESVVEASPRLVEESFDLPLSIQPRATANFTPTGGAYTVGLSYSRLAQGVHQLSPTVTPTPLDVFLVSGEHVPLTTAHSFGASISSRAARGERSLGYELGGYFRKTSDVNLGRQGELLRASQTPERGVYSADGYAYGAEVSLNYAGLLTRLDVSYAYGRSFVDADRRYPELAVFAGDRLRAPTDLPHQVNVNWAYEPTGRAAFTAGWTFVSGRPFTPSDGVLPVAGSLVPIFGQLNSARLPPTHRLDVGFTLDNSEARQRGFRAGFGISVYNLYMRDNPYLAFYDRRGANGRLEAFQFAVIGEAIPALNVTFRWD